MSIQLPPNVQPETPINTYDHPNITPRLGYGYDYDCAQCFLGHSHTHAQHFMNLLHKALGEQFGGNWTWTKERAREMHEWEIDWWESETPFAWDKAYRQTYQWP